jgi:hypothetical protein
MSQAARKAPQPKVAAGVSAYALRHHRKRGTASGCRCPR